MLEFLVRLFYLRNLCRQLHIAGDLLVRCTFVAHVVLHVLPNGAFFWSTVQIIFLSASHIMSILHAPMLLP